MEPTTWGPFVWSAIHLICLGAAVELSSFEQEQYQQFFNYIALVIPCATCRTHLQQHYREVPIQGYLKGRDSLFEWSVKLHNLVNQSLGKQVWTLENARAHWEKVASGVCETARCQKMSPSWRRILIVGAVMMMGLLGLLIARRAMRICV